ncbi:glycosyltransferase family 4 protein [Thermodesulfobacteriota bacterium]
MKMKILVLNYEFPPVGGGGGKVAEDICRKLTQKGHLVRVQTSYARGLMKNEKRDGYQIFRSFSFRRRRDRCSVLEMAAFILTNFFPALKHVVLWKPDIIHVHFAVPTGVLSYFINLLTGIPYVLTAHLGDVPGGVPEQTDTIFKFIKPFTNLIWKRASVVTAVSDFTRKLALVSYDVDVQTIYNGIDLNLCNQSPIKLQKPVRLIYAGRFNPQKNLLFLIELLNRVKDLEWRLDMPGNGPLMPLIQQEIKIKHLEDRINLHGWIDSGEVNSLLSHSDILVLPSLTEGLPVVGINAIGHGLAILGSDTGGIRDLVPKNKNGWLCPVNDFEAFEQAFRYMVSSSGELMRMKRASRELSQKFDLTKIIEQYETIFKKVIT